MRSVFIYIKKISLIDLKETLTTIMNSTEASQYDFSIGEGEHPWGFAYISTKVSDAEKEDIINVSTKLGESPSLVITIDVTGRKNCRTDVLNVLKTILEDVDGVVQDDYSSYAWRVEELDIVNSEGRKFFKPNH